MAFEDTGAVKLLTTAKDSDVRTGHGPGISDDMMLKGAMRVDFQKLVVIGREPAFLGEFVQIFRNRVRFVELIRQIRIARVIFAGRDFVQRMRAQRGIRIFLMQGKRVVSVHRPGISGGKNQQRHADHV